MSLLNTKYLVLGAVLVTVPLLISAACSGGDFSASVDSDAGSSGGASGSNGSGGSGNPSAGSSGSGTAGSGGSSTGVMCQGPEDCNDGDLCTTDSCGAGECQAAPKCDEGLKCCDGDCGQCCSNSDCADEIACTNDICFAGSCTHVADDSKCAATEYCSMIGDCRQMEPCPNGTAAECEDGDPCTADSCNANMLCEHPSCEDPLLCCQGIGCGMCCADSQCADDNPCTLDSCSGGSCANRPLCDTSGDVQCCIGPDGTSASCGTCCSAGECNDQVDCTDDACAQGICQNTPDQMYCGAGMVCDIARDCVTATQCNGNAQCNDNISCTVDVCMGGACLNTPDDSLCQGGSCSLQLGRCVQCTHDVQCNDGSDCTTDSCDTSSYTCSYQQGACGNQYCCGNRCADCCTSDQCPDTGMPGGGSNLIILDGGIDGACFWKTCIEGKCGTTSLLCQGYQCCPGFGCYDICPG